MSRKITSSFSHSCLTLLATSFAKCLLTYFAFPLKCHHCFIKLLLSFFLCLFKVNPAIPKLDLGFAINIGSSDATANMQKVKATINAVIDRYGKRDIRYSFILFGNVPLRLVSFAESEIFTIERLESRVNSFSVRSGANLEKALDEARKIFQDTARSDAKKVLVVIMDQSRSSDSAKTKEKARDLRESGVKVVPVALGDEASDEELSEIASLKEYLVKMKEDDDPDKSAEKIMDKVLVGKCDR